MPLDEMRIRYVLIAGTHDQARYWEAHRPDVNPRDVVRITDHQSLQRLRGRNLADPGWRVVLTGTLPSAEVPWQEYLKIAGWDGTFS